MRNKIWIKHVCALLVVIAFGLLASGSMELGSDADAKAVELYKAGKYEKAKQMFDNGSIKNAKSLSDLDSPSKAVQCYYYSKILEKNGRSDDAFDYLILVYNHAVKYSNLREKYNDIYNDVMNNSKINELIEEQKQQAKKNACVGTWVCTSPSTYSSLTLKMYENGSFENFHSGGSGKWSINGNEISFKSFNGSTWTATVNGNTLVETTYEPGWGSMSIKYKKR